MRDETELDKSEFNGPDKVHQENERHAEGNEDLHGL